jgi:DNA-(apurinic or apyrimidinic site) lyase
MEWEERYDPQYQSVCKIVKKRGERALTLVAANAVVCYQLSSTGEQYWEELADNVDNITNVNDLVRFLKRSKGNRRLLTQKIKRLHKFNVHLSQHLTYEAVWKTLGNLYGLNKKTTVFAVKMFGYAKRCLTKQRTPFPHSIPFPIDSRAQRFAQRFNISAHILFSTLSSKTSIPPLHLDSIIWNRWYETLL